MGEIRFIKNYKDNDFQRLSFNELAKETFGVDFEPWYEKKFWDDKYIPYSFVDGDKVISNVSVNEMSIIIEGQELSVIQIGTVMTHKDYRNKGFARRLMKHVDDDYKNKADFIFLFGNDHANEFYKKCGYSPLEENSFVTYYTYNNDKKNSELRKLSMSDKMDMNIIRRLSKTRTYISNDFGIRNTQGLLLFYMLYVFTDDIYYLEEDDMIVIYSIEDNVLQIYDILSNKNIDLEKVLLHIATKNVTKVIFNFTPDLTMKDLQINKLEENDTTLFVKNFNNNITKPFRFPELAHA
ncbi:GNAT family acetyltransferase [Vallitalea longa]|uniref:GNAT family acetyltransferase n=2 Tax=Vallitalea longa TaxID=2936439 RepID=A0A9W6DGK0_9FIRM|nr:GNAT family acetyltransferase [Vallitalea longa]